MIWLGLVTRVCVEERVVGSGYVGAIDERFRCTEFYRSSFAFEHVTENAPYSTGVDSYLH